MNMGMIRWKKGERWSDESMRVRILECTDSKKLVVHKYLDPIRRSVTRRADKTGWNTTKFDALLARMVEEGAVKVRVSQKNVGTQHRREEALSKEAGGPAAERDNMIRRGGVRKAIRGTCLTLKMTLKIDRQMTMRMP